MSVLLFVVLCLAAFRFARFFVKDEFPPIAWLRTSLLSRAHTKRAVSWAMGLTCFWCLGTWIALGTVAIAAQFVSIPAPVLVAAAVASVVGLIAERWDNG